MEGLVDQIDYYEDSLEGLQIFHEFEGRRWSKDDVGLMGIGSFQEKPHVGDLAPASSQPCQEMGVDLIEGRPRLQGEYNIGLINLLEADLSNVRRVFEEQMDASRAPSAMDWDLGWMLHLYFQGKHIFPPCTVQRTCCQYCSLVRQVFQFLERQKSYPRHPFPQFFYYG